jgi:hypothetical protein
MVSLYNFILEGKQIDVYSSSYEEAKQLAHSILQELKDLSKDQ